MKKKIEQSYIVRKIAETRIFSYLSSHKFFGRFFNYELIAYVIVGVLTTAVNYGVYFLLPFKDSGSDVVIKTAISWIFAVLFAFFGDKIFVFDSPSWEKSVFFKEISAFITARLLSLLLDALIMYISVGIFRGNELIWKIISNIAVLIANYFAGKWIVFRKKGNPKGA